MDLITVDTQKCTNCKKCAIVCPMNIIQMFDNDYPQSTQNAFQLCINCGYCVDVCAFDALYHTHRKHSTGSSAALKRYSAMQKTNKVKK